MTTSPTAATSTASRATTTASAGYSVLRARRATFLLHRRAVAAFVTP
ncbi:hypothetical protein ACWD4T_45300 [Streptomyces umbrinus]